MLVVRKAQKQLLAQALFDRWAAEHVLRFFPDRCTALGPDGVRAALDEAVRAGRKLGLENDEDLARFIDLMFVFGPELLRGDRYPWARRILEDRSVTDPRERMVRLYRAGLAHEPRP